MLWHLSPLYLADLREVLLNILHHLLTLLAFHLIIIIEHQLLSLAWLLDRGLVLRLDPISENVQVFLHLLAVVEHSFGGGIVRVVLELDLPVIIVIIL